MKPGPQSLLLSFSLNDESLRLAELARCPPRCRAACVGACCLSLAHPRDFTSAACVGACCLSLAQPLDFTSAACVGAC